VVENWRFRRVGRPVGATKRGGGTLDSGEEYARMGWSINRAIGGAQPRDGCWHLESVLSRASFDIYGPGPRRLRRMARH
jgi:hypothetical protein